MKTRDIITLIVAFSVAVGVHGAGKPVKLQNLPPAVQQAIRAQVGTAELGTIEEASEGTEIVYDVEMKSRGVPRDFSVSAQGRLLSCQLFLAELPGGIQKIIKTQAAGGKINRIDRITDNDDYFYEAEIIHRRQHRTLTVPSDGSSATLEIGLREAPAKVQKTIHQQVGTGKIDEISRTIENDEITFEVDYTRDGADRSLTVDHEGRLIEIEVGLNETPSPVQKAIRDLLAARGGTLGDIMKNVEEDENTFDVAITAGGIKRDYVLDPAGKITSAQVLFRETPAAVQKAIRSRLGRDGKLLRIDEIAEPGGRAAYDVESRQAGRSNNFTVAADGSIVDEEAKR